MVGLRNCEESESDKAIEYSEKSNCFYFPPSPTYFPPSLTTFPPSPSCFPLYSPLSPPRPSSSNSSVTYVWHDVTIFLPQNDLGEDIVDLPDFYLAVLVEHKIQDRGGALDVIPSGRLVKINDLVQRLDHIVGPEAKNTALELVDEEYCLTAGVLQDFEPLEKQNEDIVDQLVIDSMDVRQHLIQYRDGALDDTPVWGVSRVNGSEISAGQLLTSTPEPGLIFQTKLSLRVWQGHRGQWAVDICHGWNWLNTGTLKIAEGAPFSSESVLRFRGGKDLFDHPFYELLVYENRTEPTTKPRTEIQMVELPPTEEQENPDEDFELGCSKATGIDRVEAEATRNDGVEAVAIGPWNGCDSTPIQATFDTNSVLAMEVTPPRSSLAAQQENSDEHFVNGQVEQVGIVSEGTEEAENAEPQLNSGPSGKRKRKEKNTRERGNRKTTGVRNVIPLEDISEIKEMYLKDAARHLNVGRSTLKRACREYNIHRWPPREELKLLSQYSLANKSPTVVDQGQIPQLNDDMLLPSNQVPTTVSTNSTVTVKVRCGKETIKFRLSWPWETVELKQQVKKRLELEDGTYYIRYKDEDGELILIACDDDLQECISSSSPLASKSIEILLEPK